MRKYILGAILLISVSCLSGQRDTLGRYSPGFKFKDGIYLSFDDFRQNCPSVRLSEMYSEDKRQMKEIDPEMDWFQNVNDSLIYISIDTVWGYSNRGMVYVRNLDFFDRLVMIGSLSHIIHREIYLDYNNGVYGNFGYTPVRREVQIEYFIDMETGEKLEFTQRNFERHFAYDPVLLNSFKEWNKRERKEGMFQFLHNYNQANPIYFPISRCRK